MSEDLSTLPRICIPDGVAVGSLRLAAAQAKHLAALRRRAGDAFLAFSGNGREYLAHLDEPTGKRVTATVSELVRQEPPPTRTVEVWCANVRAKRMDWAVEKCTEAGVGIFRPITTERSARGDEVSASRRARWRRIAMEAAEQSGRLYLPTIEPLVPFSEALERHHWPLVVADPEGQRVDELATLRQTGSITIAIGPEGGFTPDELAQADADGATTVSFGPTALRTETAALVAVAFAIG